MYWPGVHASTASANTQKIAQALAGGGATFVSIRSSISAGSCHRRANKTDADPSDQRCKASDLRPLVLGDEDSAKTNLPPVSLIQSRQFEVRLNSTLVGQPFGDGGAGAPGPQSETVRPSCLVSCDGMHSTAGDQTGIPSAEVAPRRARGHSMTAARRTFSEGNNRIAHLQERAHGDQAWLPRALEEVISHRIVVAARRSPLSEVDAAAQGAAIHTAPFSFREAPSATFANRKNRSQMRSSTMSASSSGRTESYSPSRFNSLRRWSSPAHRRPRNLCRPQTSLTAIPRCADQAPPDPEEC